MPRPLDHAGSGCGIELLRFVSGTCWAHLCWYGEQWQGTYPGTAPTSFLMHGTKHGFRCERQCSPSPSASAPRVGHVLLASISKSASKDGGEEEGRTCL